MAHLEIEHIIPLAKGGTDDESNLWLACPICNGHKSEMPADVFLDVLLERIAARTSATLTLNIDVTDDQLVITPDRDSAEVVVQGNEVLIGGHRLVLQLARRPK